MKPLKSRNLKITCSWNGRNFSGYQVQPNAVTVEGTLTAAWHVLTKETVKITGCSRLDAGVHANHFVFNVISQTELSYERIVKSLNGILHGKEKFDICIYSCEEVSVDFSARFSSTGKHYRYLLWNSSGEHVQYRDTAWHFKPTYDLALLESILKAFEGTHDFNSFRANDCGAKNTIRTIHKINVVQNSRYPELYTIDIFGNGFLKNLIRNLVGAALLVLQERSSLKDLQNRLVTGEAGYNLCAPGYALTLMEVYY